MRKRESKFYLFIALVLILSITLFLVSGCGQKAADPDPVPVPEENGAMKVAVILFGSADDAAWNASMYDAVMRVKDDYNLDVHYSEHIGGADVERVARDYASRGYELIIAHGSAYGEHIARIAPDFPDTFFMHGHSMEVADNISSYWTYYHEGGFVAGALAAYLSETKKMGVVAGLAIPSVIMGSEGFKAGAEYVDPDITVNITYIGSFEDPAGGKEAALAQIEGGADVICILGNGTGLGSISAVTELDVLAIGFYGDQHNRAPEHVVTSVMNVWDPIVIKALEDIKAGKFGNNTYYPNLEDGSVAMAPYFYFEDKIPQEVKDDVEEIKAKIFAGEIEVPMITEVR